MGNRLIYIDVLKGIAIILVVMGHMFVPYTDYLESTINQFIYSIHMPLFFFLSGRVLSINHESKNTYKLLVIKKILTLLLPFISFSALYCYIMRLSYVDMLLKNEMHFGYWFTLVLFEISLIYAFVNYISTKIEGVFFNVLLNMVIIIVLLLISIFNILGDPYKTLFSIDKVAKFYPFFYFGCLLNKYDYIKRIFSSQFIYTICLFVFVFVFVNYGYDLQKVTISHVLLPICGIVCLTNLIMHYYSTIDYKGVFSSLGKHSLEIYFVHFIFLSSLPKSLIECSGSIYIQGFLLFFLAILIILFSLFVSVFIEQSNFFNFILFGKGVYCKKIIQALKFK